MSLARTLELHNPRLHSDWHLPNISCLFAGLADELQRRSQRWPSMSSCFRRHSRKCRGC